MPDGKLHMTLVGIYIGNHDSNIAVSIDGNVKYLKSERVTGVKHHKADLKFFNNILESWKIKSIDAIAFTDGNRNGLGSCEHNQLFKQVDSFYKDIPTFCIDHHYSHILSAWPMVLLEKVGVGIAIDGTGDNNIRMAVISNPGCLNSRYEFMTTKKGIGNLLVTIGSLAELGGDGLDHAGKIMGAQAYGTIDYDYVNKINCSEILEHIFDLISRIPWRGEIPLYISNFFDFKNQSFLDWISTIHYVIECSMLDLFKRYCNSEQYIVYSGGCAQNTVYNEKLFQLYPNLVIPPHCYDGGLSLGCLEFLRIYYSQKPFSNNSFPYWQNDNEEEIPSENIIRKVSELLCDGKIVGWFQGRGEIGPRALGHRSILMDCRNKNAKDILNEKVKHRESWRPFAPSVIESQVNNWFDINVPSPYMLRAVKTKEDVRNVIPSVVHIDGSSRIQTVTAHDDTIDPFLLLLKEYYSLTGVPMLLNTSLNAGGGPIFGTRGQCVDFFNSVSIDAICMGNKLLIK